MILVLLLLLYEFQASEDNLVRENYVEENHLGDDHVGVNTDHEKTTKEIQDEIKEYKDLGSYT